LTEFVHQVQAYTALNSENNDGIPCRGRLVVCLYTNPAYLDALSHSEDIEVHYSKKACPQNLGFCGSNLQPILGAGATEENLGNTPEEFSSG
jgi:hypothetical protein